MSVRKTNTTRDKKSPTNRQHARKTVWRHWKRRHHASLSPRAVEANVRTRAIRRENQANHHPQCRTWRCIKTGTRDPVNGWTCAIACTSRASSQGRLPLDVTLNLKSVHWLCTVWIRLPDVSPSTTTHNRRPCATHSPAASELVSITRTISNCWAEEKCDITDDCLIQEKPNFP